jgi:hypothetical protein
MNKIDLTSVVADIARESEDDHVGLWVVVKQLIAAGVGENEIVEQTISVIKTVVELYNVGIGQFIGSNFIFWNESLESSLNRIRIEWYELGRQPDIGDIAWIVARRG